MAALSFSFVTQTVFDDLAAAETLVPGTFYCTDHLIHLARTKNTYHTYGGATIQEIVDELLLRENFTTELIETITANETFRESMVQTLIGNSTFQTFVSELLLTDVNFQNAIVQAIANMSIRNTVIDVVSEIVSVVAPDGSTIAANDGGTLTLQLATNEKFGIVKGQVNTSPTTWQNVSATDGLLSVNRLQAEEVMNTKDTAVKNSVNVRAEDYCIVGQNQNDGSGMVVLPIRQENTEPVSPVAGKLYLVNENASTP